MELKVDVQFVFEVKGKKKEIIDSIERQILSDMNEYWQNDDDTAQMKEIQLKEIKK